MNVVREISRINAAELDIAIKNPSASWHEQYRDSAYIFIGGLPYDLTEGDVIAIFSQYGEVVDVNLPRPTQQSSNSEDKQQSGSASTSRDAAQPRPGKGKHRGFGFLMYEDQRSTVLAVDNLNGAQVLGRTLRVDHVASYKQPKMRDADGQLVEPDHKSLNAAPSHVLAEQDDSADEHDLEDPMAAYFQRARSDQKRKSNDDGDDAARARGKEDKARRKQERARIRAEREQRRHGSHRDDKSDRTRDSRHPRSTSDRSHRRDRTDSDEEQPVNRYAEATKRKSVLDQHTSRSHSSTLRHRDRDRDRDAHRERRRSRSPRP
ncbi:uncharacterized protein PAN0_014c4845 [Moesziomyces antarcticus]|uniref:Related to rna binding motif protein n=2 Tax=Pseudozyma antarctica TaxID=84753 RepID=A0A5C3FTN2_PSEA2|nr:uncharacterized protein PAN0_014c4845 [Moesziomyces antarcticus]GAK66622.1 conserved hypothetical protein [Moesziomyces antarcticus]SPO47672.1 related to rna binding motif protein [Moesziomyces antarcticus]